MEVENLLPVPFGDLPPAQPAIYSDRPHIDLDYQLQPRQIARRNMAEGWIYFLQSSTGYVKIGMSTNVEARLIQIQSTMPPPIEVELLHAIRTKNMIRAEQALHGHYATQRVRREWFALTADDMATVMRLNNYDL